MNGANPIYRLAQIQSAYDRLYYRQFGSSDVENSGVVVFGFAATQGGTTILTDAEKDFAFKVCTEIDKIASGDQSLTAPYASSDDGTALVPEQDYANRKFACFWPDRNSDGIYNPDGAQAASTGQEILLFWYKAFPSS